MVWTFFSLLVVFASGTIRPPHRKVARWGAGSREAVWSSVSERGIVDLVSSACVVATLTSGDVSFDSMRYWSVIDARGEVYFLARSGTTQSASRRARTSVFAKCRHTATTFTNKSCVTPAHRRYLPLVQKNSSWENAALNFAVVATESRVFGIGGEGGEGGDGDDFFGLPKSNESHRPRKSGASWFEAKDLREVLETGWSHIFKDRLSGTAKGCVETMSSHPKRLCKFDSQFSMVELKKTLLLYTRANVNASGGGRFAQVATVNATDRTFGPFQLLKFQENKNLSFSDATAGQHDLYTFLVNDNPARPGTLLALYPLVLHKKDAYLCLSVSRNGIKFSQPHPILHSETFAEGRPFDLPVDGFITDHTNKTIYLFVHANVQGVVHSKDGYPPHIVRFSINMEQLRLFTDRHLRALDEDDKKNQEVPRPPPPQTPQKQKVLLQLTTNKTLKIVVGDSPLFLIVRCLLLAALVVLLSRFLFRRHARIRRGG